jgi:hypothetical protein
MRLENPTAFDAKVTTAFSKTGREIVVLAVKGTFDIPTRGEDEVGLSKVQMPLLLADVSGNDPAMDALVAENDFAPFKPRCDVLCDGPAISFEERPVTTLNVEIRVGGWGKAFAVYGSRIWLRGGSGDRISDPRPFVEQAITYDLAWGGVDPDPNDPTRAATCEENPAGIGYYPNRSGLEGAPLPITAELGQVVTDRIGPHRPMAFGPVGRNWLPRRRFAGTYDGAWLDHQAPFLPADFDDRFHQAAPPDQQIPFPQGGEPVELVSLTPEGRLRFRLPRDRVVVTFCRKAGPVTSQIANLDTILFLTGAKKLCLTWRARFFTDRDLHDLSRIIVRRDMERAVA